MRNPFKKLQTDIADKEEALRGLRARWEQEKSGLDRIGELRFASMNCWSTAERAQRDGDFEQASRILYAELPGLRGPTSSSHGRLQRPGGHGRRGGGARRCRRGRSAWTGIPAGRMLRG